MLLCVTNGNLDAMHISTLVRGFLDSGMPVCVLVCGCPKKSKRKKDTFFFKQIKHKPHVFANTECCWQHYMTDLRCRPVFRTSLFFIDLNTKRWRCIEIVKFQLVASQRKWLRFPALVQSQHNSRNVVFFIMHLSPTVARQVPLPFAGVSL